MASVSERPLSNLELLRARPHFARLWVGEVVSRFGDAVDGLAVLWLVYSVTGSTLLMGALSAVGMLPGILLGPFAGVLVDRWPRKRVMMIGDAGRGLLTLAVALAWATGRLEIWMLFAWALVASTLEVFAETARRAVIPVMVGPVNLVVAQSLAGTGDSLAQLFGYLGAGVVVARLGITAAILLDSATFWFSLGSVALSRIPELPPRREALRVRAFVADLREGFAFLAAHRALRQLLVLMLLANFALGPVGALLPAYVGGVLGAGPGGLGPVFASLSVGALAGSLLVGSVARGLGELALMRVGLLGIGAGLALFLVAGAVWHAAGLLLAVGLALAPAQAGVGSLFQRLTPADKQGRLAGLRGTAALAIMPLSTALAGALAELLPLPVLFAAVGAFIVLLSAIILWSPALREAAAKPPAPQAAQEAPGEVLPVAAEADAAER